MTAEETKNLSLLMDVKVDVSVQLGSCTLPMKELMELSIGTVLQLSQCVSEPVKLFVNGKIAALGEGVVVDDNFGIKITEIVGHKRD